MTRTFTTAGLAITALLFTACDRPTQTTPPTTGGAATAAETVADEPFTITPKLWGDVPAQPEATYEVRAMDDGHPGLFAADGQLLVALLPELLLDLGRGSKRVVPRTRQFELVSLDPYEHGGFRLLARLEDTAGTFDLKVEAGPNDPRVHVAMTTRWDRDVEVNRQLLRFRVGAVGEARAVQHELAWAPIEGEWVSPAHAPAAVAFERGLLVHARHGAEALVVRREAEAWRVEIEGYHADNHPVEHGELCGASLGGVASFKESERTEVRADFVLGDVALPLLERWPTGTEAAVSVVRTGGDTPSALVSTQEGVQWRESAFWVGDHDDVPCEGGRYTYLAARGAHAAFAGVGPTEVDTRRVVAFSHPNVSLPLFTLPEREVSAAMLSRANLDELREAGGLLIGRAATDVDGARAELTTDRIWFAPPNEVAQRLVSLGDVDLDMLPDGVVRVRNLGDVPVEGLALRIPAGVVARAPAVEEGAPHEHTIGFDLDARGSQLLQLFRGDAPAALRGVQIAVVRER